MHDDQRKMISLGISKRGFFIYRITDGACPRYTYTIGMTEAVGLELVFAGGAVYSAKDLNLILETVRSFVLKEGFATGRTIPVENLGAFSLRPVHYSWVSALLLGAVDYYPGRQLAAIQIVPDAAHTTVDVPNLERAYTLETEPVWRWQFETWPHEVKASATVITDLDTLRGAPITEATRWEEAYWEAFSQPGPEVGKENARPSTIGVLLAMDPTLRPLLSLEIEKGCYREDAGHPWKPWGRKKG